MSKLKMIGARVDDETFAKVQAAAAKDRRNPSDWLRLLVTDALSKPQQAAA